MKKYSSLAFQLIQLARNGMLSHLCTKKAVEDLALLQPKLLAILAPKDHEAFALELSRSLRTLLTWYRDYKRFSSTRKTLLKHLKVGDAELLDKVAAQLLLQNKDDWGRQRGVPLIRKWSFSCLPGF